MLGRSTIASGTNRPVSARLKARPCEVECVVQLAWRCVSNAFKLHAGMEFLGTVALGQSPGNVHQRRCSRRINQGQDVGIGLCRGSAQTLRAASNAAPRSTK